MQRGYLPGELIKEIRKRKGLRQAHMLDLDLETSDSQVTLSRIENLRQSPTDNTLMDLLSKVALPYRHFFCPYMENQPAESFVLRRQIGYLLGRAEGDPAAHKLAGELIETLRGKLDFDSHINRQLWISLRASLETIGGRGDAEILALIGEGLQITYPEFDARTFDGDILILYECDLMLSLARCHANMGQIDQALSILIRVHDGYAKQPLSDMYKEGLLSEIQNLMVRYLLEKGDFPAALAASEQAMAYSKRLTGGSRLPETIHLRARAIFYATGDREQTAALLTQAYFAFALLKKGAMQQRVLKDTRELLGADPETFGTEALAPRLPRDFFRFTAGSALAADSIGELLRQFRLAAGATQWEVCRGICSRSFYSRIEAGQRTHVGFFILEALMQRLGRDIDQYIEYFSSIDEWEESRLRMQYSREVFIGNTEEAQQTLEKLMLLGDFTRGLGKQFLLMAEAMMKSARGDNAGYFELLHEALGVTLPHYSEDCIAHMRLTFNECNLINAIAYHYAETGQLERGIQVFSSLQASMDRFYVDDSIKAKHYINLLSNLAQYHYIAGAYEKALAFADENESMSVWHGVLYLANDIAQIKAKCLHKLGRRDEALAYGAMAYYSGSLTYPRQDLETLEAFVKEELGMTLPRSPGFVFHQEKAGTYAPPSGDD